MARIRYGSRSNLAAMAMVLVFTLLLSACINPFSSNDESSASGGAGNAGSGGSSGGGVGSIVINPDSAVGAQTIAPDLGTLKDAVLRFDVTLTNTTPGTYDDITVESYTEGDPINGVPYGTWTIEVDAYSDATGSTLIGTATVTGFVVNAATNPVTMELVPLGSGNGTLNYTLDFTAATAVVDTATVTLDPWPIGGGDETTLIAGTDYNADFATSETIVIDRALAAGTYVLRIELADSGATNGDGEHAPIVKIVQIYGNLNSVATDALQAGDLRSPPAAPSGLTATITGDNQFEITWTDESNTEEGFRVYLTSVGLRDTVGAGVTSTDSGTLGHALEAGNTIGYSVVAYNSFGESASVDIVFDTIGLPASGLTPSGTPATPYWAPPEPSLQWPVFPGAGSYELYLSTSQTEVDNLAPAARVSTTATSGQTPANYGVPTTPLSGQTYYWRVAAVNASTNGELASATQAFTVRDTLHVAATGGTDTAATSGAADDPFASISYAFSRIDASESGIAVNASVGTYTDGFTFPAGLQILLSGGWDAGFIARNTALNEDGTVAQTSLSVDDTRVSVLDYSTNANTISIGSGPGLGAPSEFDGFYVQNDTGTLMTVSNSDVIIRNNVLVSYANGNTSTNSDIMNISGDTGATTVTDNVFHLVDPSAIINQADVSSGGIFFQLGGDAAADPVVVQNNTFRQSDAVYRVLATKSFTSGPRRVEINGNSFALDHTVGGYAWAARMTGAENITIQNNTITYTSTSGGGFDLGSEGTVAVLANTITYDAPNTPDYFVDLRAGQTGNVDVRNNVYSAINYGGTARFVQTSSPAEVNIDHNTMVLSGGTAPSAWSLVYRAGGSSAVRVRNNIAYNSTGVNVGQPIYATDATGFEITANLFRGMQGNNANFYLGAGVGETTTDLNEQPYASANIGVLPALNASHRPVYGTSPDSVISGGINDDSANPGNLITTVDRDGTGRTVPVTLGAYEVDNAAAFVPRAGLAAEWLGPPTANIPDLAVEDGYADTLGYVNNPPSAANRLGTGDAWSHLLGGNDQLIRPSLTATVPLTAPEEVAISFWLSLPAILADNDPYYVASWNDGTPAGSHIAIQRPASMEELEIVVIDGGDIAPFATGIANQPTGVWHHIVVNWVRNPALTNGTVQVFANGNPAGDGTIGVAGLINTQFNIGTRPGGTTTDFSGNLDDVRVYNRTLTAEEVARLFNE